MKIIIKTKTVFRWSSSWRRRSQTKKVTLSHKTILMMANCLFGYKKLKILKRNNEILLTHNFVLIFCCPTKKRNKLLLMILSIKTGQSLLLNGLSRR